MRSIGKIILSWLMLISPAWSLNFGGQYLEAVDRVEACYLIFMRLYHATLYSDKVGDTRCVDLEYLRPFSREELARATVEIYSKRYGEPVDQDDASELQRLVDAYHSVEQGDRYRFCLSASRGAELARDGEPVLRTGSTEFARRVLGLWVVDVDDSGRVQWNFATCKQRIF